MELDQLKDAWLRLDAKLDRQYAMDLQLLRKQQIVKVRRLFGVLTAGRVLQLFAGVGLNVLMVGFITAHLDQPHLVVDGVLLVLFGVLMMVSAIREFQLIGAADLAEPVVSIQKRLVALKRWHLKEAFVFGVTGCLVWVPMTLVAFQMLFGADIYLNAPEVVLSFIVSALLCLVIVSGVFVYAGRLEHPRANRWLERHFSGRSLGLAEDALQELMRFEQNL